MWDLPRPGLEPVSPALAGRLSTTAPPGKPIIYTFKTVYSCSSTIPWSLKLLSNRAWQQVRRRCFLAARHVQVSNCHFSPFLLLNDESSCASTKPTTVTLAEPKRGLWLPQDGWVWAVSACTWHFRFITPVALWERVGGGGEQGQLLCFLLGGCKLYQIPNDLSWV